MTKDEALKLALEALEGVLDDAPKVLDASITGGLYEVVQCRDAITAIKEALAQPEQEPVAWMFQHEETGRIMFVDAQQIEWGFEKGNPRLKKISPVYTTPPQRTWVGLTDEDDLDWEDGGNLKDLVKAIENKLKQKNT